MDKEKLRKCGLSYPKVKYIKDLSSKVIEGKLKIKKLNLLDDEEIITELIQDSFRKLGVNADISKIIKYNNINLLIFFYPVGIFL